MEHLFMVDGGGAKSAIDTDLPAERLHERQHLQEWIIAHPVVLGSDVLIVTTEYDRWTSESDGTSARDRLDILGIDASGRLVVVELKRGGGERNIHLQAITYAALVSRFTLDTLAVAHREFLNKRGQPIDGAAARERILAHVGGEVAPDLLRRPRLVLVASSFPRQVTHTVVWLSEMNLDIDLVQVRLWRVGEHLTAGFTKIYPTPEVEEFTLAPAREEAASAIQKAEQRTRATNAVHVIVAAGILSDETLLVMEPGHGLTDKQRQAINTWSEQTPARGRARWRNNTAKPLTWEADSQSYSPTGLAQEVCRQALEREMEGIQGTTWWVVSGDQVNLPADGQDWSVLAGKNLVSLAGEVRDPGRDWSDLHSILRALPSDRWTTYGDLAAAVGSHAVPVGAHLARCEQCVNAWRVLRANGTVSPGFRWGDPSRTDSVADVLTANGIELTDGHASSTQRADASNLLSLAALDSNG